MPCHPNLLLIVDRAASIKFFAAGHLQVMELGNSFRLKRDIRDSRDPRDIKAMKDDAAQPGGSR
jgi:hypothetical protein